MKVSNLDKIMETDLRVLKEDNGLLYQVKQKCFENVKAGISKISDKEADTLLSVIKQEFTRDQRHYGIILEILCELLPQQKVFRDKHFTQLSDIAEALLQLLISTSKFKALTLQVSCINVLSLYPDSALILVVKNHGERIFELLKDMTQSADALKILILQLIKQILDILPECDKKKFGKDGLPIWFTVVFPYLFSETILVQQPALEIIEEINTVININDYYDSIEFKDFLTLIRNKEKYPSQIVAMLKKENHNWDRVWICTTKLLGQNLNHSSKTINALLWVLETPFKTDCYRYKGFKCWKILIDMFDRKELQMTNRIKLLSLPFNQISAKTENVISMKFEVWFHLLSLLKSNVESHSTLLLWPFLHFCYGAPPGQPKLYNYTLASTYPTMYRDIIMSLVEIFGHINCNKCELKTNESECYFTTKMFSQYTDVLKHSVKECFNLIVHMVKTGNNDYLKHASCLYTSFLNLVKSDTGHSKYAMLIMADIAKGNSENASVFDLIIKVFISIALDKDVGFSASFLIDKTVFDGDSPVDIMKNILMSEEIDNNDKLRGVINLNDKFKILIDHIIDQGDVACTLNRLGPNCFGRFFYSMFSTALICKNVKLSELSSCIFWPIDKIFSKSLVDEVTESWSLIYTSGKVDDDLNDKIIKGITSNSNACNISVYLLPMMLTKRLDYNAVLAIINEDICLLEEVLHQLSTKDKTFCIIRISKYICQYIKMAKRIKKDSPLSKKCLQFIVKFFSIAVTASNQDVQEVLASILYELLLTETKDFEAIFDIFKLCESSTSNLLHEKLLSSIESLISRKQNNVTSAEKLKLEDFLEKSHKLKHIKKNHSAKKSTDKPLMKPPKQSRSINNISLTGNSEEVVVVHPKWKFNPKKLTENQIEKLEKRRDDIPALYQDMSQSRDDVSLHSWQPHGYRTDSQDTSSEVNDTTKKAEKILKEIPNIDVCPNIISSLLVSLSPNASKMVSTEKINTIKKFKRNSNGNIENIASAEKVDKSKKEKLTPLIFLNKNKQAKEQHTVENGNLDNFVLSPNPADDLELIQLKTNEISKVVPLVKINSNNIDDKQSVTPNGVEMDRPTRLKKKPKKFDPDEHTIMKNRKSNEQKKDFSLLKIPPQNFNSTDSNSQIKIKARRKSFNDTEEYLPNSLKAEIDHSFYNKCVSKSDHKITRKRKLSIESNYLSNFTSTNMLPEQIENDISALSNKIVEVNKALHSEISDEEFNKSIQNEISGEIKDVSSKMPSSSENNTNCYTDKNMQSEIEKSLLQSSKNSNHGNHFHGNKCEQTSDSVNFQADEKNNSTLDNKPEMVSKQNKPVPKKKKMKSRLESQLEIDTNEGHPLLEKLKDKRSRLNRTVGGDKDKGTTQSKSLKREPQKLSQRGRRNSIDNSQIGKKSQRTKTKQLQNEFNAVIANAPEVYKNIMCNSVTHSVPCTRNREEDSCRNNNNSSSEIGDHTQHIKDPDHTAAVVTIVRQESHFSEDVIESSQDSTSSTTSVIQRTIASKVDKSNSKEEITCHESKDNIQKKNKTTVCNAEIHNKSKFTVDTDAPVLTAVQNDVEENEFLTSNSESTAEMDTLVLNTQDINNILRKSEKNDTLNNNQIEVNTEDIDTEPVIMDTCNINNSLNGNAENIIDIVEPYNDSVHTDTRIYSQNGQKNCTANEKSDQMESVTDCAEKSVVSEVENIDIIHDRSIISSPQKDDTDKRNDEFLNSTFDMSPITICSKKSTTSTKRNDVKDPSTFTLDADTSPDVFSMEKISLTNESVKENTNNDSPPQINLSVALSSPSIASSYKKNRSKVAQTGRGARMLGLCVPDKANTLQIRIDKCFEKISDAANKSKSGNFCPTPPNRNLKIIYNAKNNTEMESETRINPNGSASDASEDSSESDVALDMLTFNKILPDASASPSASILKRKRAETTEEASSPACKKKRVSFHDPPVSITKYIQCPLSPQNSLKIRSPKIKTKGRKLEPYFDGITPLNDNFEDETPNSVSPLDKNQSQIIIEDTVTSIDKKIYSDLADCCDPISLLTSQLASSLWENSLKEELHGTISTIGDFASLTECEVSKLSIKSPKIETARNILSLYHSKLQETEIASKVIDIEEEAQENEMITEITEEPTQISVDIVQIHNEHTSTKDVEDKNDNSGCNQSIINCDNSEKDIVDKNNIISDKLNDSNAVNMTNIDDKTSNEKVQSETSYIDSFLDNHSLNDIINIYLKNKEEKNVGFTPKDCSQLLKSVDFAKLYDISGKDEEFMRNMVRIGNHNRDQYIRNVIEEYSVNSLLSSLSDKDILNYIMQNNSTNNFLAMLGRSFLDKYERV